MCIGKRKKNSKNLTFLPKYDIGPDLAEYVGTVHTLRSSNSQSAHESDVSGK